MYESKLADVNAGLGVRYINEIEHGLSAVTGRKVFDDSIYYFSEIPTLVLPSTVLWIVGGALAVHFHVVEELERRGMPMEFALLPIMESAYDPFAYSHGRAAGLWQIIPGTGRRFGIRQNWWYDGRRDIVDSTRGALEYLTYLHEFVDGDWFLAIAAYNSGEGNVRKAVRRNEASAKPTDFWNLSLPRETSMYVPKLLALVKIYQNPARYNISLPAVADAPRAS